MSEVEKGLGSSNSEGVKEVFENGEFVGSQKNETRRNLAFSRSKKGGEEGSTFAESEREGRVLHICKEEVLQD